MNQFRILAILPIALFTTVGAVATPAAPQKGAPAKLSKNAKVSRICWEAEKAVLVDKPLMIRQLKTKQSAQSSDKCSGDAYLEFPAEDYEKLPSKTDRPQAAYKLNVKTPGKYFLWAHTSGLDLADSSFAVSVNGSEQILGKDQSSRIRPNQWHWVNSARPVTLKAGTNTIVLKIREPGVRLDQFLLCQDRDYAPVGLRKTTH